MVQNINFKIKKEGEKTYIFCLVRKKYILLTPEEKVRQLMLNYLTAELKIPLSKMAVEKSITVNGLIKRWDILVYNKNFEPEFKVVPESMNNKRTKKFQLSQGIELTIRSDAMEYPDKIVSTVVDGKRVIQIVCEDDDTYDAFA